MCDRNHTTLSVVLLSLAFAALACADTIWVPDDYPTIREAIDAADPGDQVVVRDGEWKGPGNKDLDFGGKAITVRSENGPENCTIDCGDDGSGFYFHSAETETSVVEGFTITNGQGHVGLGGRGGGIYADGASPTVVNCKFIGNSAAVYGGGVYIRSNSETRLVNCVFIGNTADESGGGMYNAHSSPVVANCTFAGNEATDYGGGMANHLSAPHVCNCILWGNSDGGGTDESAQIDDHDGSASTVTYSCIQGCATFCSNPDDHNIDCDPQFVDAAGGNLRLLPASCCIDAGDTSAVDCPPVFGDLDGYARVVDDPLVPDTGIPGGLLNDVVDMGAYEYKFRIPGDINGDGCVNQSDLGILLANWGMGCCF